MGEGDFRVNYHFHRRDGKNQNLHGRDCQRFARLHGPVANRTGAEDTPGFLDARTAFRSGQDEGPSGLAHHEEAGGACARVEGDARGLRDP